MSSGDQKRFERFNRFGQPKFRGVAGKNDYEFLINC